MGVGSFNDAARASVLRYTGDWESYVHRMGRWVDFENDYKTLNPAVHGVGHLGVQDPATTRA